MTPSRDRDTEADWTDERRLDEAFSAWAAGDDRPPEAPAPTPAPKPAEVADDEPEEREAWEDWATWIPDDPSWADPAPAPEAPPPADPGPMPAPMPPERVGEAGVAGDEPPPRRWTRSDDDVLPQKGKRKKA